MAAPRIKSVQAGDRTRYRFVVDTGRDPKTGKRKQLTRTYDRKKEAERELSRILSEVDSGKYVRPGKMTVSEYLEQWCRSAGRGREAATVENYRHALAPVREQVGAVELQKLTTVHVENLVDYMLTSGRKRGGKPGTGLSSRTVRLTLSRLRAALDSAVHRRLVEFNVAAPVQCPATEQTEYTPWTPAEVKTFLRSLDDERLRAPLLLSLLGLRPAEVCGLRWDDVDLEAGTVAISSTRTIVWGEHGGQVVEKGTKTKAGRRTLPLPEPVAASLRSFKALQARERLAAGKAYEGGGYVLCDELGKPQRTDWLRRRAYKLMAAANVRKVRLYDARHACLTFLSVSGVPDTIVSAWAGHADLSLAKRVYVHPSAADLEQGRDKLAELLG